MVTSSAKSGLGSTEDKVVYEWVVCQPGVVAWGRRCWFTARERSESDATHEI